MRFAVFVLVASRSSPATYAAFHVKMVLVAKTPMIGIVFDSEKSGLSGTPFFAAVCKTS